MKYFSRDHLFDLAFIFLPLIYFFSLPVWASDLSIWTALGVQNLNHGQLLSVDPFSFLPTTTMIYPSWGLCYLYGTIFLISGKWAMAMLSLFHKAVLFFILLYFLRRYLMKFNHRWHFKNLLLIVVFMLGSSYFYIDRPALVAVIPFLLGFEVIEQNAQLKLKHQLLLFFITLIWINIHASAFLMLLMLAWKIIVNLVVKKSIRSWTWALGICTLAIFCTPFGFKLLTYTWQTAALSKSRHFDEWMSPFRFVDPIHSVLYLGWMIYLVIELFGDWKNKTYRLWSSSYLPLSLLGLFSMRDIVWTFFLIIPVMTSESRNLKVHSPRSHYGFNALMIGAMLTLLLMLNPFVRSSMIENFQPARYDLKEMFPNDEIELIKQSHSEGRIFNDLYTGGFAALYLPNKIFVDARNIIFNQHAFEELLLVVNHKPQWQQILSDHQIEFLFLKKNTDSTALIEVIKKSPQWEILSDRLNYFLARKR